MESITTPTTSLCFPSIGHSVQWNEVRSCVLLSTAELSEKLRSSRPVLQCPKPFQRYYQKARELREGHLVQWTEVLLADSLAASRTLVCSKSKEAVTAPLVKTSTRMAGIEKKGFLRKGFLNLRPTVIAPTTLHSLPIELASSSTREVKDDGV